jgi:hypothetical protein
MLNIPKPVCRHSDCWAAYPQLNWENLKTPKKQFPTKQLLNKDLDNFWPEAVLGSSRLPQG